LGKPLRKDTADPVSLRLTLAMAEDVIGEALKRYLWMVFRHPPIERIVQEEIGQQGRYH
jgi:hypothetical protein